MFKQIMLVLSAICGVLLSAPAFASEGTFDMQKYIDGCSPRGQIYASCDPWFWESGAITQEDIFNAAKEVADRQNKLLFVFFGHDACPACYGFDRALRLDSDREEFMKHFVVVKINTNTSSGKELNRKLGLAKKLVGVPAAMVYFQGEPQSDMPIYLSSYAYKAQPLLNFMRDQGLGKAE